MLFIQHCLKEKKEKGKEKKRNQKYDLEKFLDSHRVNLKFVFVWYVLYNVSTMYTNDYNQVGSAE